jgi:hypothetical protein
MDVEWMVYGCRLVFVKGRGGVACAVWRKLIRVAEKEAYLVEKIELNAGSPPWSGAAPAEDRQRPGGLAFLGSRRA